MHLNLILHDFFCSLFYLFSLMAEVDKAARQHWLLLSSQQYCKEIGLRNDYLTYGMITENTYLEYIGPPDIVPSPTKGAQQPKLGIQPVRPRHNFISSFVLHCGGALRPTPHLHSIHLHEIYQSIVKSE